ncbi:MAG: hypothetical protein MK110_02390 [Fuerstiella sp.]|nr:hypothetical protein [Fuerstiella sp.]
MPAGGKHAPCGETWSKLAANLAIKVANLVQADDDDGLCDNIRVTVQDVFDRRQERSQNQTRVQ